VNCREELAVVGTLGPKESPEGCRSIEPNLRESVKGESRRLGRRAGNEKHTERSYWCYPSWEGSPYCLDEPSVFFVLESLRDRIDEE